MSGTRETLWIALSELWLDAELDEAQLAGIAAAVRESGFSRAEVEDVVLFELAPVLGPNLRSVAGEWAGFDPDALCARVRKRVATRGRLGRLFARLRFSSSPAKPAWEWVQAIAFGSDSTRA